MESVRSHLSRSDDNDALATDFAAQFASRPDWECVFRFYSAIHLVQAYLLTKNERFAASDHAARWKAIKASPELMKGGKLPDAYSSLRSISEQVRYDPGFKAQSEDLADARDNLNVVKSFVRPKVDAKIAARAGSAKK